MHSIITFRTSKHVPSREVLILKMIALVWFPCVKKVTMYPYVTYATVETRVNNSTPFASLSRLTVVSREAKKEQSESPKTKCATNYCVSFTRANVFVI